ncbi:C45 family autoproteolytic acyltransferase/hydolase [Fusibacter ferrireducens]|uniref:Peptidase C45 hydrolase domain-containing protein n=1 Tax=Fusibacter ferrireducens TaxID=2785058 RepID=A0ABR9ZNV6_9FIRM|nr:C45 family autoproteolytic acyltransferase/hydolase [Fusibacter ferrireducens]MBF4692126.1 hypothetical protein [Fusibacter ferrireducens]
MTGKHYTNFRDDQIMNSIRRNVEDFLKTASSSSFGINEMKRQMKKDIHLLSASRYREIKELSRKAKIELKALLCYNLYHSAFFSDGCTIFFSLGEASKNGNTLFGKNSDNQGRSGLVGDGYVENRQIHVVMYSENRDGSHVVGVSAAGLSGVKMALNSHGVAGSTNYGNTVFSKESREETGHVFPSDREMIVREALEYPTALLAAHHATKLLMQMPMATDGMVTFADSREAYVVEGSKKIISITKVESGTDSRSNMFITLDKLNVKNDTSSYCRYHRTQDILNEISGNVTVEDMKKISMDHYYGPGTNGICRHTEGLNSSTLSAAIMEIDKQDPLESKIHIALGKPCNAWRHEDGHVTISMRDKVSDIPKAFLSGEAFKKYFMADPL